MTHRPFIATASGTGQQMLEVYANANSDALDALVDELTGKAYHGNHVRVEHDVFLERYGIIFCCSLCSFPMLPPLVIIS